MNIYIYIASNCLRKVNLIKNCSIDILKIFKEDTFIQSNIEDCDMAILFIGLPLPSDFNIILEKLWNRKIILVFCGDSVGYFDRFLLNVSNVISIWCHTIFEDLNLFKKPTYNKGYRDYLVIQKNNSDHQKLKILHIEKVISLFPPIKYVCSHISKKLKDRTNDICFLGTTEYDTTTDIGLIITTNKIKGIELIQNLKTKYKVITGKFVYEEFINILRNTKICISPQGWGEFSYKEYEAVCNGCIVIKNCDYRIKSNPNIYDNIIYCNFNYDNLIDKLEDILPNSIEYQTLVDNGQNKILNFNENEQINQISNCIIQSYNNYKINHSIFENLFFYQEHLLYDYKIMKNNINIYLKPNLDEKEFNSFGFFPITDHYIYFQYKCFQDKRYKCHIKFKSSLSKIRYYDGNNWNTLKSNNTEFEIEYEHDFSKYIKPRIGFCYDRYLNNIEIEELYYEINIIY